MWKMKKIKKKIIQNYKGKKILLGVSAGISLYKSIVLLRLLIKNGADVKVIMTPDAAKFINPIFFSTLSKNKVYIDFVKDNQWENHVELGLWADLMIIAPVTANTLAKLANGCSDNFLIATYLSLKCDVFIFPSMDRDMYKHSSTKSNITKLKASSFVIEPNFGELASGVVGEGRLPEPNEIISHITSYFVNQHKLKDKKVLITAGPTHEFIDSVRYMSNLSSGKMGFSLAKAAANMGANVDLVIGPNSLDLNYNNINTHKVVSAKEMYKKVKSLFSSFDIIIMAAAVGDYRVKKISNKKLKKHNLTMNLELVQNKDILFEMGQRKKSDQILVGFALEDRDEVVNARKKLISKNLDMIVLNSLNNEGSCFVHNTNSVKMILQDSVVSTGLDTKDNIAVYILDFLHQEFLDKIKISITNKSL